MCQDCSRNIKQILHLIIIITSKFTIGKIFLLHPDRKMALVPYSENGQQSLDCGICFGSCDKLLNLPCSCKVCKDCLFSWCKSYCEDNVFANAILVPCPFDRCKKPMTPDQFVPYLEPRQAETINEYLLRHYMTHQNDIQICPQSHCNYGGVSGFLQKNCHNYECPKCNVPWKDQSQVGMGDRLKTISNNLVLVKNELLSNLVKLFLGNYCPNCFTHITKLGGCQHMVCSKCKYEFCWFCLDAYYGYRHTGTRPCGLRPFYLTLMIFFLLSPVLARLSIIFPILTSILYFLMRFPLGVIEVIGVGAFTIMSVVGFKEMARISSYSKTHIFFWCLGYTALFAANLGFNYILYSYSMLKDILTLIFYFVLTVGIGAMAGGCFGKASDEWRYQHPIESLFFIALGTSILLMVLSYYFGYYAKVAMFLFFNLDVIALIVPIIFQMFKPKGWKNYGYYTGGDRVKLAIYIVVLIVYNSVLAWYDYTIVLKLLGYLVVITAAVYSWWIAKFTKPYWVLGTAVVGTIAYFKYVVIV